MQTRYFSCLYHPSSQHEAEGAIFLFLPGLKAEWWPLKAYLSAHIEKKEG